MSAVQPTISRHILIIEDNLDIRESLQLMLQLEGHQVIVAESGPTGVALALNAKPEVALIDIGLPGLNGFQVAQQIRASEINGDCFLIALTGHGQPEDRQKALEAGFNAHLIKPPDPDRLNRLLNELKPE